MSENQTSVASDTFTAPPTVDLNAEGLRGSIQQVFSANIGKYVSALLLIGMETCEVKEGYVADAGASYVALYEPSTGNYTVFDVYSIKTVTFLAPGNRPDAAQNNVSSGNNAQPSGVAEAPQSQPAPMQNAQAVKPTAVRSRASAQAAFNYAKRKARR